MERGDPLPGVQGPRSQLQKGPVSALEAMALCPYCAQMPPGARTLPREHKVRGPGKQEAARPSAPRLPAQPPSCCGLLPLSETLFKKKSLEFGQIAWCPTRPGSQRWERAREA